MLNVIKIKLSFFNVYRRFVYFFIMLRHTRIERRILTNSITNKKHVKREMDMINFITRTPLMGWEKDEQSPTLSFLTLKHATFRA